LDEVFVKINGEKFLLWCAVDHEDEVLEAFVSKKQCKRTALKFVKKLMKKYGNPHEIVTDKLASYGAALNALGAKYLQNTSQYHNNRSENSQLLFRSERGQSRSNEVPLYCRNSPPYTVQFIITLITKDI
jgi:putative transposase